MSLKKEHNNFKNLYKKLTDNLGLTWVRIDNKIFKEKRKLDIAQEKQEKKNRKFREKEIKKLIDF